MTPIEFLKNPEFYADFKTVEKCAETFMQKSYGITRNLDYH
jgi:hypothetical protein